MKILKPGKPKRLKLRCFNCGCEFVFEYFGNVYFTETARVKCPQDGCDGEVLLQSGEPYEEPTEQAPDQEDIVEKIADLIYSDFSTDADTAWQIGEHLVKNGVTFKEE